MKTRTMCLAVVTSLLAVLPLRTAQAGTAFSVGISVSNVSDFYAPLTPYGHWVHVADYGRCWYPSYISSDWQPYANGHWEWTDQGWYWVSDEPWAWATYHYGRWVYDPYYGWIWAPDTVWGPSWVAWREGGGYYGWAPLPPVRYCGTGGLVMWDRVGWFSRAFVFVEFGSFCRPIHYRGHHHHHRGGHHPVLHQTVNITNIQVVNNHTHIHRGPTVETVQRHVGRPVETNRATDLWQRRSGQVMQRASLDRAPAPPTSPRGLEGATERPQRGSRGAVAEQPTQQRETERREVTPRPQPQRAPERRETKPEQRHAEATRPTITKPDMPRQQPAAPPQRMESRPQVVPPQPPQQMPPVLLI